MIVEINAYQLDRLGERYPMLRIFTLPVQLIDGVWGVDYPWMDTSNYNEPTSELRHLIEGITSIRVVNSCVAEGDTLQISVMSEITVPIMHSFWQQATPPILEFIADYLGVSVNDLTIESDADKLEVIIAKQIEMMTANQIPVVEI